MRHFKGITIQVFSSDSPTEELPGLSASPEAPAAPAAAEPEAPASEPEASAAEPEAPVAEEPVAPAVDRISELMVMTKAELVVMATEMGIDASGNKSALAASIAAAESQS